MAIRTARIYDEASKDDGFRVLVDRLWPRGIKKADAGLDEWLKDVGPSKQLRSWFGHDPERFTEFARRYRAELKDNEAFDELRSIVKKHTTVTLLFGAKDTEHNQAVVLAEALREH